MDTAKRGSHCEALVEVYLRESGYRILERNYRCREGEIDILSLSPQGLLCVTEVKSLSRAWSDEDLPYMVNPGKLARLRKTLMHFLAEKAIAHKGISFDVAAVSGEKVKYYSGVV